MSSSAAHPTDFSLESVVTFMNYVRVSAVKYLERDLFSGSSPGSSGVSGCGAAFAGCGAAELLDGRASGSFARSCFYIFNVALLQPS